MFSANQQGMKRRLLLILPALAACGSEPDVEAAVRNTFGADAKITAVSPCSGDPGLIQGSVNGIAFVYGDGEVSYPSQWDYLEMVGRCHNG